MGLGSPVELGLPCLTSKLTSETEVCFSGREPMILTEALFKHGKETCGQEQVVQICS